MTTKTGRYALDTNIAIALLNGDPSVATRWSEVEAAILPAPVLGELLYGARRSARKAQNENAVWHLAQSMQLAACDRAASDTYARVKAELARIGHPIPENDVWIAACTISSDATLATRDSHFNAVGELTCEEW